MGFLHHAVACEPILDVAFYRMGVGMGDNPLTVCLPIITDMFRPERLAVAISLYSAIYIGSGQEGFRRHVIGFALPATEPTVPLWVLWHCSMSFAVGFPSTSYSRCLRTSENRPAQRNQTKGKRFSPHHQRGGCWHQG